MTEFEVPSVIVRWATIVAVGAKRTAVGVVCLCSALVFAYGGFLIAMTHFDHGDDGSAFAALPLEVAGAIIGLIVAFISFRNPHPRTGNAPRP
jgi:hypothetical protein